MPKLQADPTTSIRRRSTRSPVPPSSTTNSSDIRSPDATAYQLLVTQLEREEWRQLCDRKGGFALVKKGHTIDDAVEGESMLIEEGFTLQKYQDLFFTTMEEEELQEWTDRLPDHPKLPAKSVKKNRVSISPSDEEEEGEGYEVIGGSRAASSKKKGKKPTNKKTTQAKNKRKRSTKKDEDDLDSDGEDGIPGGELRRFQKELFDTWLSGKAEFDSWSNQQEEQSAPKKKKSFKAVKAEVAATRTIILENKHENEKMVVFKKQRVDPLARKVKVAVDEYVEAQAAALKKDLLEEMLLDDYPLSDEEEEQQNGAECGGEEKAKEIEGDDEVNNSGSKGSPDSFDGKSKDEVEAATALLSSDWTTAVIGGSDADGNGSS